MKFLILLGAAGSFRHRLPKKQMKDTKLPMLVRGSRGH